MSPEEHQLLTALFDRVRTASATPRDSEAETLIDEQTRRQPYATYYLAQAVIVQEKGLEAASKHIQDLEARVHELENAGSGQRQGTGGFLGSIFGSSEPPRQASGDAGPWSTPRQDRIPAPNRAYDDNRPAPQSGGPWGGGQGFGMQQAAPSAGGSFLRGALGTAAGVAGGMLLANSLSGIFGSHMSGLGLGSPALEAAATPPVEETTINNYYGDSADAGDNTPDDQDGGFQQADDNSDDTDFGSDDFGGNDTLDT